MTTDGASGAASEATAHPDPKPKPDPTPGPTEGSRDRANDGPGPDGETETETNRPANAAAGPTADATATKDATPKAKESSGPGVPGSGFRMVVQPQHARKRKRQAAAAAGGGTAGSPPSSSKPVRGNVFGEDYDEEEEKRARSRLSMSLSGSSSSSDDEDAPAGAVRKEAAAAAAATDGGDDVSSVASTVVAGNVGGTDAGANDRHGRNHHGRVEHEHEHEAVHTANAPSSAPLASAPTDAAGGQDSERGVGDSDGDQNNNNNNNNNKPTNDSTLLFVGSGGNDKVDPNKKKDGPIQNQQQQHQQHQQQQQQQQQQQPEGWRVKLYRLNADGSWDDCGTGRILCLYKQKQPGQKKNNNSPSDTIHNGNGEVAMNAESNPSQSPSGPLSDSEIYVELGEPTLCMHSEVASTNGVPSSIQQQQQHQQQHQQQQHQQSDLSNSDNQQTISARNTGSRILLRTRILLRDAYQRQGDNIITWCEPYLEEGNPTQGVDLALSFQDNKGCIDIWRQITQVQSKANEKFRLRQQQQQQQQQQGLIGSHVGDGNNQAEGDDGIASKAAMEKVVDSNGNERSLAELTLHANLQPQELWANVAADTAQNQQNGGSSNSNGGGGNDENDARHQEFEDAMGGIVAAYHDAASPAGGGSLNAAPQLPNPPTLERLEEISDIIARIQNMHQRESLAVHISQDDCYYLKSILSLFPPAEAKQDLCSLTRLAACVKNILLLNDPSILESIVNDELVFEDICTTLEYDPDLRDKANHRWFLRERAKFRTVALMEDEELIGAIHRSFRVNYLKDTLLRPTMDESSLSTLSSLQTFTHADVVKGVTMSPFESDDRGDLLRDSYLAKVIRILGHEMDNICDLEWRELENLEAGKDVHFIIAKREQEESSSDQSTIIASGKYPESQKMSTIWKQHLAPQDNSTISRRIRRRGSLSFLRELFNMVRISLHQTDKDDFFAVLVSMEVDLSYPENELAAGLKDGTASQGTARPINFLLLLATVLSDPETDVTDKGLVLEIIAGIAMHDPSLIRRKCLEFYASCKNNQGGVGLSRPRPNGKRQVIFQCPPNDLLASLLFLLAIETDAGLLLQVSEIMRIILDTDVVGENRPMNAGFADEAEGIPPSGGHNPPHDQHPNPNGSGNTTSTEQNQFLSAFYDHYVQWLAAPFQYAILFPLLRFPTAVFTGQTKSRIADKMFERFERGDYQDEPMLHKVPFSALRSSFAVELLSFCVRAHQYRMKMYLLRSRVLGNVLKLIRPSSLPRNTSGDRCLKLAALRFLRAVLSVEEDLYHRHIIQDDLFGPVFEAFRANPVGDNLVSSSIVEMCDFINSKNTNSLIEYIVTKHIFATGAEAPVPSLEDVSSPYVSTLTCLRQSYENLVRERNHQNQKNHHHPAGGEHRAVVSNAIGRPRLVMNERAIEDQRRFREADQEESYFDRDDDE